MRVLDEILEDGSETHSAVAAIRLLMLTGCRRMKEHTTIMSEKNPRVGSTLESLLREDGVYEDVKSYTIKSVLVYRKTKA